MYCNKCGKEMKFDQVYCGNCGAKNRLGASTYYAREFKKGNRDAFSNLYEESCQTVLNGIGSLLGNDEEAIKDCMQLVYFKVYTKIDKYDPDKSFSKWIYTIARNTAIDELRKQGKKAEFKEIPLNYTEDEEEKEIELVSDYDDFNPTFNLDESEKDIIVRNMINSLPEASRECIILKFVEGLHIKEIAELLDTKEANVKKRISYGKKLIEKRTLEYESKGLKLYNVAPFTFFIWLLRAANTKDTEYYISKSNDICDGIIKSVESVTTKSASKKIAHETVNKKAAKTTSKKIAKATISKKVVAIIAASAIGGGAVIGTSIGIATTIINDKKEAAVVNTDTEKTDTIDTDKVKDKMWVTEEDINKLKDHFGISRSWPVKVVCEEPYYREGIGLYVQNVAIYTEDDILLGFADVVLEEFNIMSVWSDQEAIENYRNLMETN